MAGGSCIEPLNVQIIIRLANFLPFHDVARTNYHETQSVIQLTVQITQCLSKISSSYNILTNQIIKKKLGTLVLVEQEMLKTSN